MKICV